MCNNKREVRRAGAMDARKKCAVDESTSVARVDEKSTLKKNIARAAGTDSHLQTVVSDLESLDKHNLWLGNGIAFQVFALRALDDLVTEVVLNTVLMDHTPDHVESGHT